MATFAEKVWKHRGRMGLTQKQLGEKAGITYRMIVSYETGRSLPRAAQLYKLAKALDVSVEYLKDDTITDPRYNIDSMEYVEGVRRKAGNKAAKGLEEMLSENTTLFAGGDVDEDAKDIYFQAVSKAYLTCLEIARHRYGRRNTQDPQSAG